MTMITLTTGTAFIMWLGEQITERGIGNGISLIIFAGIVTGHSRTQPVGMFSKAKRGTSPPSTWPVIGLLIVVVDRRDHLLRARATDESRSTTPSGSSGSKIYGGQTTHLPLKVNTAGAIPPIFASSLLMFPAHARQLLQSPGCSASPRRCSPGDWRLQHHLRRRSSSSSATSTRRSRSSRSTSPTT